MFISSTKQNVIYSLIKFGSQSKPEERSDEGDRRPDVCVSKLVEATCCLRDLAERLTNGLSSLLLECTSAIPRDPLGLRHSRPTGFDCADGDVNRKNIIQPNFY